MSRAAIDTLAARFPPALSPATATRFGSPPNDAAFFSTHSYDASASSCAAGNLFSGAIRYSTATTFAPDLLASARIDES